MLLAAIDRNSAIGDVIKINYTIHGDNGWIRDQHLVHEHIVLPENPITEADAPSIQEVFAKQAVDTECLKPELTYPLFSCPLEAHPSISISVVTFFTIFHDFAPKTDDINLAVT